MRETTIERRRLEAPRASESPQQTHSEIPQLWEVTAVASPTCTIQLVFDSAGALISQTQVTGVKYGTEPAVGDQGMLIRLADHSLYFFAGGADSDPPRMIRASAYMTADDTAYSCTYLDSDGTVGNSLTCKRPNGVYVSSGAIGFLGSDTDGDRLFIPANMRMEDTMELSVEVRQADPVSPTTGRIWLRSDL